MGCMPLKSLDTGLSKKDKTKRIYGHFVEKLFYAIAFQWIGAVLTTLQNKVETITSYIFFSFKQKLFRRITLKFEQ